MFWINNQSLCKKKRHYVQFVCQLESLKQNPLIRMENPSRSDLAVTQHVSPLTPKTKGLWVGHFCWGCPRPCGFANGWQKGIDWLLGKVNLSQDPLSTPGRLWIRRAISRLQGHNCNWRPTFLCVLLSDNQYRTLPSYRKYEMMNSLWIDFLLRIR